MNDINPQVKARNRLMLLLLAGLFAAPVLLATLMHSQWWDFRPAATKNHGELLQPPIEVTGWKTGFTEEQTPVWTLASVFPENCDARCIDQLGQLRQVRAAQGRHREQLAILLVTPENSYREQRESIRALGSFITADTETEQASPRAALQLIAAQQAETFIIDPSGFIIMRYPANADPGGIRKDIAKLLRLGNKTLGFAPERDDMKSP